MIRNLKTLGVALCAVLALTAVVASAASAAKYTAASYPTTGTGESPVGNDTFKTEAGTVECKSHFEGTLTEASATLTVKPTYTNCRAFGFLEASVEMNGCHYQFTEATFTTADEFHAVVHFLCTTSATKTKVKAGTCELEIGEQSPGGVVNITNNTAAGDVSVKAAVTGIKYTVTQDGFGCPFGGTGAKEGGTYTQDAAVTFDSTNGATIDVG